MPAAFYHSSTGYITVRSARRPQQTLNIVQPKRTTKGGHSYGYAHTVIDDNMPVQLEMNTAQKTVLETMLICQY